MKFVKLTTDLIELRTDSGIVYESFTSCITTARVICMGETVQIYVEGRYINIEASEVTSTQVLPAAEVPFPALGTGSDLLALLNADFFEVCGAGGGTIMDGYPASSHQGFVNAHSTANPNFVMVPDKIEGIVVDIEYPCTLESSRINIVGAAAGAAVAGIYKYDRLNDIWNLYAQIDVSSQFNLGVASTQEMPYPSEVIFEPGVYCSVIHGDSAATIYSWSRGAASTYFGFSPTIGTTSERGYVSLTTTYTGNLPLTANFTVGYRSGGLYPFILHKVIA